MSVLIDTSVWSLALRRHHRDLNSRERAIAFHCRDLIIAAQACLIGPILQEILSGIPDPRIFLQIKDRIAAISEFPLTLDTFSLAAEFFSAARRHGISPDHTDMTICAAAHLHNTPIFTTDPDFLRYAKHLPISLHAK